MRILYLAFPLWVATTTPALSVPLIEELLPLNFGTLAVGSNDSISRYTYPATGSGATLEGQFALISSGSPGSYALTGFPASTTLDISLDTTILETGSTSIPEPLNVDNYDIPDLVTDANGEAELSLGARLNTTGNAASYVDGTYNGTTIVSVEYWDANENSFLTESESINLQTELRSALTYDQEQALNFGTLFARSSTVDQAALSLAPNGDISISEPGDSRLVAIVNPENGILRVSGAAPIYNLTITVGIEDVLLEHSVNPDTAPHFILSDLLTSPSITGTTDANGELLIQTGGTLKTEVTASPEVYPDGQYEGSYQLTVSY